MHFSQVGTSGIRMVPLPSGCHRAGELFRLGSKRLTVGMPRAAARCMGPVASETTTRLSAITAINSRSVSSPIKSCTRVQDLMGLLTLRELMAVMAESRVVVSLATGPMHLAAALGIPTVSLFDPRRNNSPARWQPLGKGTILMPDVPTCEKCIYEACPYWDCLDRITVESVVARVR